MSRFSIITYIALFCFSSLIAQELCIPSELEATSGNRSIFFSWKDINDNSIENIVFQECFEFCGIPASATIVHEVDNGGGGWYRNGAGEYYCWYGLDCDLSPDGVQWAAPSHWTSQEGIAVDSRMIFGPFNISAEGLTTLEFLEQYAFGDMATDVNTVEISTDNGASWEAVFNSDPSILDNWTVSSVDLTRYAGQSIHVSFRYVDNTGDREGWIIDQVTIKEVIDGGRLLSDELSSNQLRILNDNPIFSDIDLRKSNKYTIKKGQKYLNTSISKIQRSVPVKRYNGSNLLNTSFPLSRSCSDPENELEVSIVLSEGDWAEEISWFLNDSLTGDVILSGIAPFDTTICLPIGYYTLMALDSYGDGWNNAVMTITDVNSGVTYLNFSLPVGSELSQTFYLGPQYGCTDPLAINYDPLANTDDGSCEYDLCDQNQIYLYCSPGGWPQEVSWSIYDSIGTEIISGLTDQFYSICIPTGEYKVVGFDTYGDGWNGAALTGVDTSDYVLFSWTFNQGYSDSTYFWAGPKYGCTDPFADNYDETATIDDSSCVYTNCAETYGYAIYKDGLMVGSTTSNYHSFIGLQNGTQYSLGVAAIYGEGTSEIASISAVPWNDVIFDPLIIELDTLTSDEVLSYDFTFQVDQDVFYTSPFEISSEKSLDIDYETSMLHSDFNSSDFTNMYDPSGLFGGLWLLGDPARASSDWFVYDSTLDSSNFTYINDDAIGAAGGAESAYLITNEITRTPGQRVFATFDVYFPQFSGSCANGDPDIGGGTDGEGFSEDLFFMVSADYGGTWTVVDSTLGGNPNWTSRMFEITDELAGATSFIAALYYTDCNGNWAYGVGIDNFAVHLADESEIIAIDPYSGWVEAGAITNVSITVPNNQYSYMNTTLQLNAGYETLNIPITFGLSLSTDENGKNIIPLKNTLHQNYPNPFNPITTIPFDIVSNDQITLMIYNIRGEMVRTLVNSNLNPGSYEVRWNGKSDSGINMSAGMYFIELKGTNFRETNKMIYLK